MGEDRDRPSSPATAAAATPRDAATVLLLRPAANGFEVFMVKRHGKSTFMGGVHVFPGGKLNDADTEASVLNRVRGLTPQDATTRLGEPLPPLRALGLHVAAARETFEEASVLLGENSDGAAPSVRASEGQSFADLLRASDAYLRADRLVPWTRWITPLVEPKRFDTRFFLCEVTENTEATHDAHETTDHAWFTPAGALDAAKDERISLAPPTERSLAMLADFQSIQSALRDAMSRKPPRIQPHFSMDSAGTILALPGDPAHPEAETVIPGSTRFVLTNGRWWAK